jgi:threonine dehydratase
MDQLVAEVLLAPIYDVAVRSPLEQAQKMSTQAGVAVWLKREDLQPVHSFKIRGAYNKMSRLSKEELSRGVIAASAGNHAQGVALSAQRLGVSALIIMPKTTPSIKVEAVKSFGADVELYGDSYSDAAEYCKEVTDKTGRTFLHPFDDPLVIAGQGTVGREIIEQHSATTHIFVPVGGGGLLAGIAQYVKSIRPDVRIIGVEPEDSNAMQQSLKANKRLVLDSVGIFADGVAVKQVGEHTFRIAQEHVDEVVTVTNDQICAGIKATFEDTRTVVEPAGALSAAAIMHYDFSATPQAQAVAISSGANMSFERLQYIAERTLIGSNQEALYSVQMPERPGALQHFTSEVVNGYNISQFGYRLRQRKGARILVGIGVGSAEAKKDFESRMRRSEYAFHDLSGEDIAKEHVRHMIGGPAPQARHEHIYRILFPERPGALDEFLKAVSGKWNISLFHYRGQGGDVGSVLIGFEAENRAALESALSVSGYDWFNVSREAAIEEFLQAEGV